MGKLYPDLTERLSAWKAEGHDDELTRHASLRGVRHAVEIIIGWIESRKDELAVASVTDEGYEPVAGRAKNETYCEVQQKLAALIKES